MPRVRFSIRTRVRVSAGRLGRVRPLPVLGLAGVGYTGTGRVGLDYPTAGPVSGRVGPTPDGLKGADTFGLDEDERGSE
jgi:hypothetical protein